MKLNVGVVCCGLLAAAVGTTACSQAGAATVNAVATGNWSAPATWNPALPAVGDQAKIDGGLTVSVDSAGDVAGTLDIGTIAAQAGNLSVAAGGDLEVSGGGLPSVRVGQAAGSTGSLTMTGGTVNVTGGTNNGFALGDLLVGDVGSGTLTLSGGDFRVSDEIPIAVAAGSTGIVNVSGGSLQTGLAVPVLVNPGDPNGRSILVGFGGNGTLNVSGTGFVRANFDMLVGFLAGSSATINQSGGTIEAGFMFSNFDNPGAAPGSTVNINQTGGTFNSRIAYVMGRGPGTTTLNHSAGAINVTVNPTGDFVVSDGNLNTSTYNISGTATTAVARDFVLGTFGGSNGTVNQTGGSITTGNNIRVGADHSLGHWNLSGGTVNAKNAFLGDFDSSNGFMKVSGGTLALTGNLSVGGALASNAPPVPTGTQGQALDANGTFTVSGSGGTINVGGNLLANPDDNSRFGGSGEHNDGALIFEILNNSGVSRINVTGAANLHGADIDVNILGGSFPIGSTFDLITAANISHDWVQVPSDIGVFSLSIIPGGNGQILRATLVPEPGTFTLICLVATSLVCGRRRRSAIR